MREKILSDLRMGADLRVRCGEVLAEAIEEAASRIIRCLRGGGKVLFFGNGGSAADAQHLAAEFVGRFRMERGAYPAVALTTDTSIITAVGNDYGFDSIFVRQIEALAQDSDVAFALSTSGTSPNVVKGAREARRLGCTVIALTGEGGGTLSEVADVALAVPSADTPRIQEMHITIGHIICDLVEESLVAKAAPQVPEIEEVSGPEEAAEPTEAPLPL